MTQTTPCLLILLVASRDCWGEKSASLC